MARITRIERVISYQIVTDPCDLEDHNVERMITQADNNIIHCFVESESQMYGRVFTINIDLPVNLRPQKMKQALMKVISELQKRGLVDGQFYKQLSKL